MPLAALVRELQNRVREYRERENNPVSNEIIGSLGSDRHFCNPPRRGAQRRTVITIRPHNSPLTDPMAGFRGRPSIPSVGDSSLR